MSRARAHRDCEANGGAHRDQEGHCPRRHFHDQRHFHCACTTSAAHNLTPATVNQAGATAQRAKHEAHNDCDVEDGSPDSGADERKHHDYDAGHGVQRDCEADSKAPHDQEDRSHQAAPSNSAAALANPTTTPDDGSMTSATWQSQRYCSQ